MKVVVNINDADYKELVELANTSPRNLNQDERLIAKGKPLSDEIARLRENVEYPLKFTSDNEDYDEGFNNGVKWAVRQIDKICV